MTLLLCLIFGSKAYIVFRGQGKGGSDESSRVPTSKFISKSRSGQTTKQTSAHNSTTGLHSSTTSTSHDPNLNSRLSEDVQEEFRRLYFQLEELKERNMRLGNRHLVAKIAAMQEAADNILCTSAQINGQQTGSGSSPNVKGKSGVLSDISEENPEENPSLPQSTAQTPKLLEATGNPPEFFSGNPAAECEEEDHRFTTTINNSPLKDPLSTTTDVAVEDGDRGQISQSKSKDDARRKRRDVVQFKNLELQDTNLDEVDSEEDERGVKFDLGEDTARSDIKPDCINDADAFESNKEGCENIPMQSLRKRRHKQKQSSTNPTDSQSAMHSSSSEIGKQQKSQNHSGTNNSKLVLDLDDKSRFTEEITV